MPEGTSAGGLFFFRLALSEGVGWLSPVLLTAALTALVGYANRFNALVSAINWLSIPFAYANGLLLLLMLLLPEMPGFVAFIWLLLLGAVIISMERIFRMICGPNILLVSALILVQIVPALFLSDWIDSFLGIAAP